MKLQLTVFATDLEAFSEDTPCSPFAVVAQAHGEPKKKPTVLGKSETLKNTRSPDFTKIFIIHDFQLGKAMHILVTIHDSNSANKSLGSAMFDVGAVLGTKGGVYGKQVKSGGCIMVHIEPTSGKGVLNLQLKGLGFVSNQEQIDPYFELQKKRTTNKGETVWDVVYRATPVTNSSSPLWPEISVDFGTLCGGDRNAQFRISVKDYDDREDCVIGNCQITVNQLLKAAPDESVKEQTERAIDIKLQKPRRKMGKLVVISASISDPDPEDYAVEEENSDQRALTENEDEEDIIIEATDNVEMLPDELGANVGFADYISGGCQLRVIVAIDYTASNGDPRKEDSLHHFKKNGMNAYEATIAKVCSILSEFDSDQKYPVWGFGAKKNGKLSQCFPVGEAEEVEGVDGILDAYKSAFQGGIAMSKPTDITAVIKAAGKKAQKSLEAAMTGSNQEYTILTIFTNGSVHSVEETIAAFADVMSEPLSIVVIGVGPSDFADMSFIKECQAKGNRVHFVDAKAHKDASVTEASLSVIPEQLTSYFQSKGIQPGIPIESDEIVIEPFSEENEVVAAVVVSGTGDIEVDTNATAPAENATKPKIPGALAAMGGKGQTMVINQAKRQFGRVGKQMQRNFNKLIDQKVNKIFGISSVTSAVPKKQSNRKKK